MRGRRLDRLFARFRNRGDARALAKLFDATAPELYRVATHLAKDLHVAEDLVQSTYLAAIEARESWDESREVMPWLIGILARQAAYERRRRSRTIEPERLERPSVPEPVEAAEAQELSAELERSIDGIPALYREVLIAHLKQGKTPQEIARDLGRAPGTVRVQLHRALEMVRKTLPVGLATGGMIAALSPRGLSAVRAIVLRSASRIPVPTAVVATPVAVGGSIMSAKVAVAVSGLALCLAFAGRWAFRQAEPPPGPSEGAVESVQVEHSSDPGEEIAAPEELTLAPPSRTPVDMRAPAVSRRSGPSRVSGRLLTPDGNPAAGVFVALVQLSDGSPSKSVQEKKTATDGAFFLVSDPGLYLVVGLRDACLPLVRQVTLAAGSDLELEPATFTLGERIGGHVRILGSPAPSGCGIRAQQGLYDRGFPLGGQDLVWTGETLGVGSRTVRTDDLGRFVIEGLEPGMHTVSFQQGMIRAKVAAQAPADDVALEIEAARLIVRVRSEGLPVDSHIAFHENGYGGPVWGFGSKPDLDIPVPCGSHYVVDVDKDGFVSAHFDLEIPSTCEKVDRTVEIVRRSDGAELALEVVTPDGTRIRKAGFGLFGTQSYLLGRYRPMRRSSHGREPDIVQNVVSEDGLFRFRDLPPDRYRVEVVPDGDWDHLAATYWYCDPIDVDLSPRGSEQRRVDVHLGGRFRIRCMNRKGDVLPAHCQLIEPGGAEVPLTFLTQDDRGSMWRDSESLNPRAPNGANETAPSLPPGRYELRLSLDGYREASRFAIVEPGKISEVSVVLDEK